MPKIHHNSFLHKINLTYKNIVIFENSPYVPIHQNPMIYGFPIH